MGRPIRLSFSTSGIYTSSPRTRRLGALRSDKAAVKLQMRNAASSYPPAAQL
jgi:hypothetical protein